MKRNWAFYNKENLGHFVGNTRRFKRNQKRQPCPAAIAGPGETSINLNGSTSARGQFKLAQIEIGGDSQNALFSDTPVARTIIQGFEAQAYLGYLTP